MWFRFQSSIHLNSLYLVDNLQGDRVILGGDHYFRFNHPIEVAQNKKVKGSSAQEVKDFEFAKAELLQIQESRLDIAQFI